MNKKCSKSKSRVNKDENVRRTRGNKGSDEKSDNAELPSAEILPQNNSTNEVKDSECGDVSEQPQDSQESFIDASQEAGSQREVRWDYQSPETVKKLRKCRGQHSYEEVRNIVNVFDDTDVQSEDSLLNSVKLYLPSQDEAALYRLSNQSRPRDRVVKRYKQRALNKDSVQHMLAVLKEQAEKPKSDCRKQLKRLSDGSAAHASESCDGSDLPSAHESEVSDGSDLTNAHESEVSDGSDLTNAHESEVCDGSDLTNAHGSEVCDGSEVNTSPTLSQTCVNREDTSWSDDDLFTDNSFIIEATQNPEKFLAAEKTQRSASRNYLPSPQADESVGHKSLLAESFVIPPSCTSKQSTVLVTKSSVNMPSSKSSSLSSNRVATSNTCKNIQTLGNPGRIPSCLSGKHHVKNTAHSFKTNSTATSRLENKISCCPVTTTGSRSCSSSASTSADKQVIQNSQTVIVNPPEGKYKTSFRKFSSFNISSPKSSQNDCNSSKRIGNSNMNSSFRKTLSFDSSVSSSRAADHLSMPGKLSVPDFPNKFGKLKSSSVSHDSRSEKNVAKPKMSECLPVKVPDVPAVQEDGFDVSLPEEVFQKLLEVDEILDSQACAISTTSAINLLPVPDKSTFHCDTSLDSVSKGSSSSKVKLAPATSKVASKPTFANSEKCAAANSMVNRKSDAPKAGKQTVTSTKPTESLVSPIRSVGGLQSRLNKNSPVHAYYKKTFSLQQRSSPSHVQSEKHSPLPFPSSSTPVKGFKSDESSDDDVQESFLDSVFDDSFSNDHAVFESQIVPFLEKVEADAVQTQIEPSIIEPSVSAKCSSEEIEQKRQAALQKRNLKLSQSK